MKMHFQTGGVWHKRYIV